MKTSMPSDPAGLLLAVYDHDCRTGELGFREFALVLCKSKHDDDYAIVHWSGFDNRPVGQASASSAITEFDLSKIPERVALGQIEILARMP